MSGGFGPCGTSELKEMKADRSSCSVGIGGGRLKVVSPRTKIAQRGFGRAASPGSPRAACLQGPFTHLWSSDRRRGAGESRHGRTSAGDAATGNTAKSCTGAARLRSGAVSPVSHAKSVVGAGVGQQGDRFPDGGSGRSVPCRQRHSLEGSASAARLQPPASRLGWCGAE